MAKSKLNAMLMKGVVVGATGAVLSVLVLGGLQPIPIMGGMYVPKFAVHGVVLTASSVAAGYAVPALVPFVSIGSPQLKSFENLVLEPLVLGAIFLGVESFVAPAAQVGGAGSLFANIAVGSAASIGAAYISEGMKWTETVLG